MWISARSPHFYIYVAPLGAEFWSIRTSRRWSELTPKVSLGWRASRNALLHVCHAQGFKGGGKQGKPGTRATALFTYASEVAWAYALGARACDQVSQRVRTPAPMARHLA